MLGSAAFRDELAACHDDNPEIPALRALRTRPSLAAIREFVTAHHCDRNALSPRQQRDAALYLAQRQGYRLTELAAGFGMNHYSSVSSAIRRLDITQPPVAKLIDAFSAKAL